jgi:hypothetical protein
MYAGKLYLGCRILTVFETLYSLLCALVIRILKRDIVCALPPVRNVYGNEPQLKMIVSMVERLIKLLLFWKPGTCFYRSYALAYVLRKRGIPLNLNFGTDNLDGKSKMHAHCWLTLGGNPFAEETDPQLNYPINMGNYEEEIYYWLSYTGDYDLDKKMKMTNR